MLAHGDMSEPVLRLAVCGLHLKGQPLHSQLTDLHAVFIRTCLSVRFTSHHGRHKAFALMPSPIYYHPAGLQLYVVYNTCRVCVPTTG